MSDVVVIGSLNIDLVVRVDHFPLPGETLLGSDLLSIPGGKGANQAAAAAKLGKTVSLIGRVGNDGHGKKLLNSLTDYGVDISRVIVDPESPTGSAIITIDKNGENCIVISPGANGQVSSLDIDKNLSTIQNSKYLLLQYEIPLETIYYAAQVARLYGVKVIVNSAPFKSVEQAFLKNIDILILNEVEASALVGNNVQNVETAKSALKVISLMGPKAAIITLGKNGCVAIDGNHPIHFPSIKVNVVDTTAAGDAFVGGLVSGLLNGDRLIDAAKFANLCGAMTVTRLGAQISLPSLNEVVSLLE